MGDALGAIGMGGDLGSLASGSGGGGGGPFGGAPFGGGDMGLGGQSGGGDSLEPTAGNALESPGSGGGGQSGGGGPSMGGGGDSLPGMAGDPVIQSSQMAQQSNASPATTAPGGQQSSDQSFIKGLSDQLSSLLFGSPAQAATPAGGPGASAEGGPAQPLGFAQNDTMNLPEMTVHAPPGQQPQPNAPGQQNQAAARGPAPRRFGSGGGQPRPGSSFPPLPTPRPGTSLPTADTGDVGQQGGVAAHPIAPGSTAEAPMPTQGSAFPGLAQLASGAQSPQLDRLGPTEPPGPQPGSIESALAGRFEDLGLTGPGLAAVTRGPMETQAIPSSQQPTQAIPGSQPTAPPTPSQVELDRMARQQQQIQQDQKRAEELRKRDLGSRAEQQTQQDQKRAEELRKRDLGPALVRNKATGTGPETSDKTAKTAAKETDKTPDEMAKEALDRARRTAPPGHWEPSGTPGHWEPSGGPGGMGQGAPTWVPDTPARATAAAPSAAAPAGGKETAGQSPYINEPPFIRRLIDLFTGNQGDLASMAREAQQYTRTTEGATKPPQSATVSGEKKREVVAPEPEKKTGAAAAAPTRPSDLPFFPADRAKTPSPRAAGAAEAAPRGKPAASAAPSVKTEKIAAPQSDAKDAFLEKMTAFRQPLPESDPSMPGTPGVTGPMDPLTTGAKAGAFPVTPPTGASFLNTVPGRGNIAPGAQAGSQSNDYDHAAAAKAGVKPDARGHLPDTYKRPNHITFSNESIYHGKDGAQGGQWQRLSNGKWQFTPGPTNLKNYSPEQLQKYFREQEPDAVLNMPGAGAGGAAAPQRWPGSSIQHTAANALAAGGASPNATAGIMANIGKETSWQTSGPASRGSAGEQGLVQMRGDELSRYRQFLTQSGAKNSPQSQMQFLAQRLKTGYPDTWAKMNAAKTPAEAASIFAKEYEKPAARHLLRRLDSFKRNGVPSVEQQLGARPAAQAAPASSPMAFDSVTMTDPKTGAPWKSHPKVYQPGPSPFPPTPAGPVGAGAAPTVPQAYPDWEGFFNNLTSEEKNAVFRQRWPEVEQFGDVFQLAR